MSSLQFWQGFFDGAIVTFVLIVALVVLFFRAVRRNRARSLAFIAGMLRGFSRSSGFKSVLVVRGAGFIIVPILEISRAIDRGDLLTDDSVVGGRDTTPPPPQSHDGTA